MALEDKQFKEENKIGRILENGDIFIDKNKESKWINEKSNSDCENCIAFPLCLGLQCIYNKHFLKRPCKNIYFLVRDELVLMNKENLDNIIELHI